MATTGRQSTNHGTPDIGDRIEDWVTEQFGYDHVDAQWYDHRGTNAGRKIQVKGTRPWLKDGYRSDGTQRWCRGRFKVWEKDHQKLYENDGVYLLVLYTEQDDGTLDIVHWKFASPEDVTEALPDDWWDVDDCRTGGKGRHARINWSYLIDGDAFEYDRRDD